MLTPTFYFLRSFEKQLLNTASKIVKRNKSSMKTNNILLNNPKKIFNTGKTRFGLIFGGSFLLYNYLLNIQPSECAGGDSNKGNPGITVELFYSDDYKCNFFNQKKVQMRLKN